MQTWNLRHRCANRYKLQEYTSKSAYEPHVNDPVINALIEKIGKNAAGHHVVEHKYGRVTELGKQFANICLI